MLIRILIMITLMLPTSLVFGQAEFNIVLVIDESGSMWGSRHHPEANDKYRHRVSIVENVLVRLAEQVKGTSLVHRISVVEFGGDAAVSVNVPISNVELKYDPAKPNDIISNAKSIIARTLYARKRNMGNTNTALAIKTALTEFKKIEASRVGAPRERKMLIITDGRPYIYNKTLTELQKEVTHSVKSLEQSNIQMWIVGLNDASNYWNSGDGIFWKQLVGIDKARLAETSFPNIPTVIQNIIDQWLHVNSISLSNNAYHSRPYLDKIIFNVHLSQPGTKLEIINPNGQAVPQVIGMLNQGNYVRYIVDKVIVGTYHINKLSSSAYKIFVEEHAPKLTFIGPQGSINQNMTHRIVFKVIQGNQGVQELTPWPVTAHINVLSPLGQLNSLPATFEGNGKYSAQWTPQDIGAHQFSFKGIVNIQTTQGLQQYDLVDSSDITGNATVHAYTPSKTQSSAVPKNALWLHLETPVPREDSLTLSPLGDTAPIKFSLYQGEKHVIPLNSVIKQPETWLTLEIMDKSGIAISDPIPLSIEDDSFIAQIPIHREFLGIAEPIHFRVRTAYNRILNNKHLNGIWLPELLEDQRLSGDPMTVTDIEIKVSFWILLLRGFIALLFILMLLGLVIARVMPLLTIRTADRGKIINLLIYDGLDDPGAVTATKLCISGQLHSKLDRQIQVMLEGSPVLATLFRVTRQPNTGEPQITLKYRWQNEPKNKTHTLMLFDKTPQTFEGLPSGHYMIALDY